MGDLEAGRDDGMSSGRGLGLAIVKSLVEAMSAGTAAESIPGEGTCILFWLRILGNGY